MKRRINIWDTNNPNSNKKSKGSRQANSDSHYHSVNNEKPNPHTPVQSTFEYEQITPTSEAEFYSEIEHEEGDYPIQERHVERRGGGGILKLRQKRRSSLSVAVSEEEKELLREAARKKGMTFSNWARKTLFRSAGMSMPKRPK
jgi:hypothetical protein